MKNKIISVIVFSIFCVLYVHSTPFSCKDIAVSVQKNDSIHDVATALKDNKCLRFKGIFENYGVLFNIKVQEGLYVIPEGKSFFEYLFLFENNTYRQTVKITIPEGSTNKEIATQCELKLPNCDSKRFEEKAKDMEGYIFPNTYEFVGTESEDDLIKITRDEFDLQVKELFSKLTESEKKNVVILASILEKEANNEKDMRIVSGILYKRLKIGMALQVDATLFYERGKTSAQLAVNDLRKDSLYNTYTNRGLPPTAIANPGIIAIQAALNPESSPYLFYLTGNDGKMYYARTHEEHVKNKELYLR